MFDIRTNFFLLASPTVTDIFLLLTINESCLFLVCPSCRSFAFNVRFQKRVFYGSCRESAIKIAIELQLDSASVDISSHRYVLSSFRSPFFRSSIVFFLKIYLLIRMKWYTQFFFLFGIH